VVIVILIILFNISRSLETIYANFFKKPFFLHLYGKLKKLPISLQPYLKSNRLYPHLNVRKKKYFEHRTASFLEKTEFVGREGQIVSDSMRMQIATMVIQLTFGMRDYHMDYVQTVIFYPSSYFSILNQTENKGEFNPISKALVLSWEHFQEGNMAYDSGVNLGIHEITHAIHYKAMRGSDISSEIFHDTFRKLEKHLADPQVNKQLLETNIIRAYGYTDKFEFIAVLVENFMEAPERLRENLPSIYTYVKQMLNFYYFDQKG